MYKCKKKLKILFKKSIIYYNKIVKLQTVNMYLRARMPSLQS